MYRTKFNISTHKHMNDLAREDINVAMTDLLQELHTTAKPSFVFADGVYTANVPCVEAMASNKKIAPIKGEGDSKDKALKSLFMKMLNPSQSLKGADPETARLYINTPKETCIVGFTRPQV